MLVRVVLTIVLAAGFAVAQRGGGSIGGGDEGGMGGGAGGAGGAGGGMEGGGMPRAMTQTPAEAFMDKLKMKQDQKEETVKILTEAVQKARPVIDQINRGRQMIATSLLQKKTDEEMKPLMVEYTKVYAQVTGIEAEAFGKIYAILKPNQQKGAAQAFDMMNNIFMPRPAGGARGMGRQGGGGGGSREGGSGRGGRN